MKKNKCLLAILLTTGLVISTTIISYAGTWEQNGLDWKYKNDDGSYATGWILDKDAYYYYFDDYGLMLKDCVSPDGYYVAASGRLIWNVKVDVIDSVSNTGKTLATEAKAAGYTVHTDDIIIVFESKATYNQDDIILTRSGNEYTFDIRISLKPNFNRKAIQQLSRLINIPGVSDAILNDNDNEVYPVDQWVDIGNGHQIMVHQKLKTLTYIIK